MPEIALPLVDEAVEKVRTKLASGATRSIAVVGVASSGRSTVLRRLERELGGAVFHVSFPRHGEDRAPVALVELASKLDPKHAGLLDEIKVERPWTAKLGAVTSALAKETSATLLFDEPELAPPSDVPSDVFGRHAVEFSRAVLGVPGMRSVVTVEPSKPYLGDAVELRTGSSARSILTTDQWTGELESFARRFADTGGIALDKWSPLELRLAVAVLAGGASVEDVLRMRGRALGRAVLGTLERTHPLQHLLQKLALVRLPFGEDLLTHLRAPAANTELGRLLRSVYLFEVDGRFVLHDLLADLLRVSGLQDEAERRAHHEIAAYYDGRFEQAAREARVDMALRIEMEAVHHLTHACDLAVLDSHKLYFVEQLDALGKTLSLVGRRSEAVACYDRAIAREPKDAYAHHYKAYNLDYDGLEPAEVESRYLTAIELESAHVWHHGRYICFLVTRGRVINARRAWVEALSQLSIGERLPDWVYRELHRPVATLLLHRGELDFAKDVLEDASVVRHEPWMATLWARHEQLREAERDEVVFPPHILPDERWTDRPHLVPQQDVNVKSWMPGRVERLEGDHVMLRVAQRSAAGEVRYARRRLKAAEFQKMCAMPKALAVTAGTFVEIVKLGSNEVILLHDPSRSTALPPIKPPPDRYLRRAAASA